MGRGFLLHTLIVCQFAFLVVHLLYCCFKRRHAYFVNLCLRALARAVFPAIVPVMLYSYNRFESAKCGYFVWSRILKSCLHCCALLLQELLRACMLSPCCFSVLHGLFLQVIQTRSKTIKTLQNVFLGVCLILVIFHLPLQNEHASVCV